MVKKTTTLEYIATSDASQSKEVFLKKVIDKKPLPPGVQHKVLTKEDIKRLKREATDRAKSKLNMEVK